MTQGPGVHSPVGASSIKRVLACPASISLSKGIEDPESDQAALGTAVHGVIEACFKADRDAWEFVGDTVEGLEVTAEMANNAQIMLDAVRQAHPDRDQSNFWVERRFHCPTIHPLFYGTSDAVHVETKADGTLDLHVWDYKNGFMTVEHVENEQGMYYACGALEDLLLWDKVERVVIHIVQPNGFHVEGKVRAWETTPEHLTEWLEDQLVPGIDAATVPTAPAKAVSGSHCVFCPARSRACPALMADMDELETLMKQIEKTGADALSPDQLARFLKLQETAKIVFKAAETTAFNRIQGGATVPGYKLAKKVAHRVLKDGAEAAAKAEFGANAYVEPKLKSAAQLDELPMGSAFTARWAYKPDTGLTLVKATDSRPEVSSDTKSLFTDVTKKPALRLVARA